MTRHRMFCETRGGAALEYMAVFVVILMVLVAMTVYFRRSVQGRWRDQVGTLSSGRIHGAGTVDCYFDGRTDSWANTDCYDANCRTQCDTTLGNHNNGAKNYAQCLACIGGCGCAAPVP